MFKCFAPKVHSAPPRNYKGFEEHLVLFKQAVLENFEAGTEEDQVKTKEIRSVLPSEIKRIKNCWEVYITEVFPESKMVSHATFRGVRMKTDVRRKKLGFPPIEGTVGSFLDFKGDVKGLYLKHGWYPFPAKIQLFGGGQFIGDLDYINDKNLLKKVGGQILATRCKHHGFKIKDTFGILTPSDFIIEYFSEDETRNEKQTTSEGLCINYDGNMVYADRVTHEQFQQKFETHFLKTLVLKN